MGRAITSIKLQSSTLVESVIALALLASVTSIIFLVISNVNRRSNVGLKVRAFNGVKNIYSISLQQEEFSERTFDFKNFYVVRKSESSSYSEKLIIFSVTAFYKDGPQIARKQCLVQVNQDDLTSEKAF